MTVFGSSAAVPGEWLIADGRFRVRNRARAWRRPAGDRGVSVGSGPQAPWRMQDRHVGFGRLYALVHAACELGRIDSRGA